MNLETLAHEIWLRVGAPDEVDESAIAELIKAELAALPEPVAWGLPNSAITGRRQALLQVELEIPSTDQYGGALWIPLYATQSGTVDAGDGLAESMGKVLMGCSACEYDEATGDLVNHCAKCCERITTWLSGVYMGMDGEELLRQHSHQDRAGWVSVPMEPTEEMLSASGSALGAATREQRESIYRFMLAAAPK